MKKIINIFSLIFMFFCLLVSCNRLDDGPITQDELFDGKTPKALYGESINKYKNHKDSGTPYSIGFTYCKPGSNQPEVVIELVYDGNNFKYTVTEGSSAEEIIFHGGVMYFKDKNGGKHFYDTSRDHVEKYVTEKTLVKDLIPAFPENIPNSWFDDLEFVPSEGGEHFTVIADSKKEKNHPLYKDFYESDVVCKLHFTKDGILEKIELENVTVKGEKSNVTVTLSWSENNRVNAPSNGNDFSHKGDFDFDKGHKPGDDNRPPVHTHSFGEWVTVKNGTCEKDGLKERECSCGEKESEVIPATDHDFHVEVYEEHTSSTTGRIIYVCMNCGDSYWDTIGHIYSPVNVVEPTCENEGYTEYACACGNTIVQDFTDRVDHTHGDKYYVRNEAGICDCEWENPWTVCCINCGIIQSGNDGASGHVYATWIPVDHEDWIPVCERDVCEVAECEKCSCHRDYRIVAPAPGHNYVDGYCTVCGEPDPNYIPETPQYSEGLEYTLSDDGTCYVSRIGNCTDNNIIIPSVSPQGWQVTAIGAKAFQNCTNINTVVIPSSVTRIGEYAFGGCYSLGYLYIECSKASIYDMEINGLTEITIPNITSYLTLTYISAASFFFYSETQPTEAGWFWHYIDGVPTVW